MPLAPGTLLNSRYRINSILGQGGMGAVYRAVDENLLVQVAVKENLFLTDEYTRQFQREARILAGLRHSNLPHVLDYFSMENQGQYLVMDYIEGEDLRQRMERQGTLTESEVVLVGISICDALQYLHSRQPPIVHRDIKPGNIKVTPDGLAVLVDFGLAKIMQGSQATSTGARAMTPGYSPPEQYGTARTDARSDIYSLGATLYASLTAVIPEDSLARMTGKTELTPLRDLAPRISRKLSDAIEQALEIDPDDRFQTAEEFRKALVDAGELSPLFVERPTITPPPEVREAAAEGDVVGLSEVYQELKRPSVPRSSASRRRRRLKKYAMSILPVFAVVFALTSVGLILRTTLFPPQASVPTPAPGTLISDVSTRDSPTLEQPPERTATVTGTATAQPTPSSTVAVVALVPTLTPTITPSPSPTPLGGGPSQIAFASDRTGNIQLWLMNGDGNGQRQLTSVSGGACQPSWSPDGMKLVFTSPCPDRQTAYPGSALYILNLEDNTVTPLPSHPEGDFDPAWSPDGKRIAFTSLRKGYPSIYMINLDTQTVQDIDNVRYSDSQPSWSPGGMQLAFVRGSAMSQIWVMADNGLYQAQFTANEGVANNFPTWSIDGQTIYFSQSNLDALFPWLVGMTYENRGKPKEFRVPPKASSDQIPVSVARISPDGYWFVFDSWPDTNFDVYLMKANGSDIHRLTTDPGKDFGPAWRPASGSTP